MSKNKGFSNTSANRYSLALFELATEANILNKIEENSNSFLNLMSDNRDFDDLVKDPTISQDTLMNIINKISENFNIENFSRFKDNFFNITLHLSTWLKSNSTSFFNSLLFLKLSYKS